MKRSLSIALLILVFLAACTPSITPTPEETVAATETTAAPSPTPSPEPVAVLNVCTAALPAGLFPYDGRNPSAKQALLAWTQPGISSEASDRPALLTAWPTVENGGISLQAVEVQTGELIVDANGNLTTLKSGVAVRPSGCRSSACALTWDGAQVLSMDQMSVTFRLQAGLSWSDGTPLKAEDSVFSFDLASDPSAPGLQWAESRTSSYIAQTADEVLWVGRPGFTTADIESLFWQPLPAHLFAADADWYAIANDPVWSAPMPALGRYQVADWGEDGVRLVQNDQSATAEASVLPYGEVDLRVIPDLADAVAALAAGTCDVLDASYRLARDAETLSEIQANADLRVLTAQTASWTQLVFGIQPASYDEFYNPLYGDRPDFFGDARTRQAFGACLDREAIRAAVYGGLAELWPSFVSQTDSVLAEGQGLAYDPALGGQLLESVGWRDHDLDPATPLQAWYIGNIPVGTPFSLTLYTDPSVLGQQVAAIIQRSLGECGIEITPVTQPINQLYASGPEGPLFGRQFDLALIGWSPAPGLDCSLYESSQMPTEANNWIGTNIAGLADAAYDAACVDASLALPSEGPDALNQAELQYHSSMPAVPLFSAPETMAVSREACAAVSALWGWAGDQVCP
jgi:peptide/nickel transport system substrate-binding protein